MQPKLNKRFFSLKWKAGLLFGCLVLLVNMTFPLMVNWDMKQKFALSRQQLQQQYQQEFIGQLKTTSDELQRLAEFLLSHISNTDGMFTEEIIQEMKNHQSELELNWNVSSALIYNRQGVMEGGWGQAVPDKIITLIASVADNEHATTQIDCTDACLQYQLLPILSGDKTNKVVIFTYDLSNVLLNFAAVTGADLAIISRSHNGTLTSQQFLPGWDRYITALTSYSRNIAYLQTLSSQYPLSSIHQQHQLLRDADFPVEFQFFTLHKATDIFFIIIDNIATQQQAITHATYRSFLVSLLGVLLLGGGLFFFLSNPLIRLSTVSRTLPLLAKQKYDTVREIIQPAQSLRAVDELDVLETAAHSLSIQLEQLQQSVKERSLALNKRTDELQRERDFIKSLIDTARLIIMTLDDQLQITSFNRFAEQMTGFKEADIINTPLQRFFGKGAWPQVRRVLVNLRQHKISVAQQETEFIDKEGQNHIISWLHSGLANSSDHSIILSVGLDITEKKHSEQQIMWMADHDALTELYNRRKFNNEFEKILNNAERYGHTGYLLFLDLDQFKDINDSCGHNVGDQLLRQVGQTLLHICRSTDLVARLGGDEFAIILPESDDRGAVHMCEKITSTFNRLNFSHAGLRYSISCSIGLLKFPMNTLTVDELLSNADLAMYQAKSKGKNTWHQFTVDDMTRTQLQTRVMWKQKIEDALKQHQLIFYYQPIMDIRTRTVSHYEVLLRMLDNDDTLHLPAAFIQVAEQTGLIHSIDHYVLEQGIYKQAELDKENSGISLSLNLSGHAIVDPDLLPLLKRFLKESGARPHGLIFELTETAAVADITQAKVLMQQMNELGCRFSLDDFGTGFASFRYMREFPVDIVKIDGSFISHIITNPDDRLFVKALVDVAKGMGKKTIAEFVENAETLKLLAELGVDYAQGYYIGRPAPHLLSTPPQLD